MDGHLRVPARATALVTAVVLLLVGMAWTVPGLRDRLVLATALAGVTRIDMDAAVLDSDAGSQRTNYLVVGTDQRHVPPGGHRDIRGERADAILLLSVAEDGEVCLLSIPRDLRVHVPGHGDGKLGGALEYGPAPLVDGVRALTGLPVHHYVEVEFSAFLTVVDRLGGLAVDLASPVRDRHLGLALPAGPQTLTGTEALAFVRSRAHERQVGGEWVQDLSGDLGRIERQHLVLATLPEVVRRCGGPGCARILTDLGGALVMDPTVSAGDLRELAAALTPEGSRVSTAVLPTRPTRSTDDSLSPFPPAHLGNVGYREVDHRAARPLLEQLGGPAAPRTASGS